LNVLRISCSYLPSLLSGYRPVSEDQFMNSIMEVGSFPAPNDGYA